MIIKWILIYILLGLCVESFIIERNILQRRNKFFMTASFAPLPHSDTYILDTSLLIGLANNDKPVFKNWANEHIHRGNKLYYFESSLESFRELIPGGCEMIQSTKDRLKVSNRNIEEMCNKIYEFSGIHADSNSSRSKHLRKEIKLMATAGYYAASSQIPINIIEEEKLVVITSNVKTMRRVFSENWKRHKIEDIVKEAGLGYFLPIRLLHIDGSWEDIRKITVDGQVNNLHREPKKLRKPYTIRV